MGKSLGEARTERVPRLGRSGDIVAGLAAELGNLLEMGDGRLMSGNFAFRHGTILAERVQHGDQRARETRATETSVDECCMRKSARR
jgi:hypothetical protein